MNIDKHKKRPSSTSKNEYEKTISEWMRIKFITIKIMKEGYIKKKWIEFINEYSQYHLLNKEEIWEENLRKIKEYIDINKKKPSRKEEKYI